MKNILLAVVGLNPQVVTETLYALHQQGQRVDAIHLITTREGKEAVLASILSPRDGHYRHYLAEYDIDPATIAFGFENVHTIMDDLGNEIDDIESEEENEGLLRQCLELTFHFTADPDTAVFFSIAGGRKTMSACLMVAAQFYGRPQDRVFHVLVTPEFESNRNFYYPPKSSLPIELHDKNGQPYIKETRYAAVNLVPIPFVSIRDQLSDKMLRRPKDPATLLISLIREEPYWLTVDMTASRLIFKKRQLDMMPARLALYACFALHKKECRKQAASCRNCTDCYWNIQEILGQKGKIAELYRKLTGSRDHFAMSDTGILSLGKENFNSYRSKIRKEIERGFGPDALREIAVTSIGVRPDTRYGIKMERNRIKIVL